MNRSTVWVILLRVTLTLTLVMVSAGGPPAAGADRDASNRTAPATPPPAPVVTASRSGDAIVLTWAPTPGAAYYQVWRATEPYFTAPDPAHPERLLGTVYPSGAGVETYTDSVSANLDNPLYHTFYIVVAFDAAGEPSTGNMASGEFEFGAQAGAEPTLVTVTGRVLFNTGDPVAGAQVTGSASPAVTTVTDPDGYFSLQLGPAPLPLQVRIDANYTPTGGPPVQTTLWQSASSAALDVGTLELLDPAGAQLQNTGGGVFTSDTGDIVVTAPPEVATIFADAYTADENPDLFPGDLGSGNTPFNNALFVFLAGQDASGAAVTNLSSPATVRVDIPRSQWGDLEDLTPGNGQIDIPIYAFDETTGLWERQADGLLVNASAAVIPEAEGPAIRSGAYAGQVFAQFQAAHFSWWNVDYPPPPTQHPDFGDAPDPTYPSKLASNGARHLNPTRAWLGSWVDGEPDAQTPNLDEFDDGLLALSPLSVRVSNWDWTGSLYLNALVDLNDDGDWADPGEWVVANYAVVVPVRTGVRVDTGVAIPPNHWTRITLTAERLANYTGRGAYAIGETEDHPGTVPVRLDVEVQGNGAVVSAPPGIQCGVGSAGGSDCSHDFPMMALVELTALPVPGEVFLGWDGDCGYRMANPTCILIMDRNKWVMAKFSAPPPEQFPTFSVAPAGPSGLNPADILFLDPISGTIVVYIPAAALGLLPGDDLDALSYGFGANDQFVAASFSTRPGAVGLPATDLNREATCPAPEVAGDEYSAVGRSGPWSPPWTNIQRLDEDGASCVGNRGHPFLLQIGDDVDALEMPLIPMGAGAAGLAFVEPPPGPEKVFFSLAPGSPSLLAQGWRPADILVVRPPYKPGDPPPLPVVFASQEALGLMDNDDVDAIALVEDGDGVFTPVFEVGLDALVFSLATGSPTLAVKGFWPGDLLLPTTVYNPAGGPPLFMLRVIWPAADLGLAPEDDLNALKTNPWLLIELAGPQ